MRQSKTLKICANHLGLFIVQLMTFSYMIKVDFIQLCVSFDLGSEIWTLIRCDAVIPTMTVQEHAGNEKSCVWHAADFADGELKDEFFCIRFASLESKNF